MESPEKQVSGRRCRVSAESKEFVRLLISVSSVFPVVKVFLYAAARNWPALLGKAWNPIPET
jgi:hypothetical protein